MRGGRRGGLWSEWAGTLLSPEGGTLFNILLEIGMSPECPPKGMSPVSGTGSERAQDRDRLITEPPGIQRSVPEEAVHREGRCAPSGEAPGRGVPAAVR